MGLFGSGRDRADAEDQANLRADLKAAELKQREMSIALQAERKRSAELLAERDAARVEVETARAQLARARQRQRASVERAERFKQKLALVTVS